MNDETRMLALEAEYGRLCRDRDQMEGSLARRRAKTVACGMKWDEKKEERFLRELDKKVSRVLNEAVRLRRELYR